jgi:hypothetical protein
VLTPWPLSLLALVILLVGSEDPLVVDVADPGRVFTVSPTGADDTANLQVALDACVSEGPGCTVRLTEGTFHTAMLEVTGFDGFFRGAGQGVTVVTSLPDLKCAEQAAKHSYPVLIKFREGHPQISHLTFQITDPEPCEEPWTGILRGNPTYVQAVIQIAGAQIDETFNCTNPALDVAQSSIDHVGFMGSPAGGVHSLLLIAGDGTIGKGDCVARYKPLGGTHSVTNSTFQDAGWGVDATITDGSLTVGGSPSTVNTFENCRRGIATYEDSNADIEVSYNEISNASGGGVIVSRGWQARNGGHPLPALSRVTISHNTIHAIDQAKGIQLTDRGPSLGGEKTLDAIVYGNQILLTDARSYGIWGTGAQDILVLDNTISGSGDAGIHMGSEQSDSGWVILRNDVADLRAQSAHILLGVHSNEITVVGSSTKTTVADLGANNTLVGVTTTHH